MSQLNPSSNIVALYEAINGQAPGYAVYNNDLPLYTSGTAQAGIYLSQEALTDAAIALTQVFGNLGLATTAPTGASAAVVAQAGLYAAMVSIINTPANGVSLAYGVNWLVSALSTIPSTDANYANYSTAKITLNTNITNGVSYSATSTNTQPELVTTLLTVSSGLTYTLTTGQDTATANIFSGVLNASATVDTVNTFDTLTGASTGTNVFNIISDGTAVPSGVSLTNIPTVNIIASGNQTASVASWTGVTTLNVTNGGTGTDTLTVAATTNVIDTTAAAGAVNIYGGNNVTATTVGGNIEIGSAVTSTNGSPAGTITVTDTTAGTSTINVDGGTLVSITESGTTTGGAINIGVNTQATGAIIVGTTTGTANSNSIGAITITGGTTVTVTEAAGDIAHTGTNVTQGNVVVKGTTSTTAVTVDQATSQTGLTAVSPTAGVVAVLAVTAAPGTTGVSAVAGVTPVAAVTGLVGASTGTINISDSVAPSSTAATGAGVTGGTIIAVSLNNFGATNISSPALNSLTLAGTSGAVNLYEGGSLAAINTTLTLNVNNLPSTAITDNSNQFKTLNMVTGTTKSTLASFTDTALTTLNVSGSSVVTDTTATPATAITVTGSAGFTGTINDTTTTFNGSGSSGADTITISADATKAISGGSGSSDEVIIAGNAVYTAAKTGANVTGFETLGFSASTTQDASVFGTGITKLDVTGTGQTDVITNVDKNAGINFATGSTSTTSFSYTSADSSGSTDTATITLQGPTASTLTTGAAQTVSTLTMQDANSIGIGTLTIVDNNPAFNYNGDNIATLNDTALSTLNFSGVGGLTIGGTAFTDDAASSLAINNTGTNAAGLTVTMTDNSLGNLTFTGAGSTTLNLTDSAAGRIAITNSGTGSETIVGTSIAAGQLSLTGAMTFGIGTDNNITALTLTKGQAVTLTDNATTGLTITGGTDNSRVALTLGAAASGNTNTVLLGNANNYIADATTAGKVVITVGSGSNMIDVHTGSASTYSANITLGTHTNPDTIKVGRVAASASAPNTVINGAVSGDTIIFYDGATSTVALSSVNQATVSGESTLGAAVNFVADLSGTVAHSTTAFQYGGNTYLLESAAGQEVALTANDGLVELANITSTTGIVTSGNGTALGVTFALTNLADNFTGGAGNDTFNGLYSDGGALNNTFNASDILVGGGGTDTLNISSSIVAAMTLGAGASGTDWNTSDSGLTTLVIKNNAGAGAITFSSTAAFNDAFSTGHLNLTTSAGAGATIINLDGTAVLGGGGAASVAYPGTATIIATASGAGAIDIHAGPGATIVSNVTTTAGEESVNGADLTSVTMTSNGAGTQNVGYLPDGVTLGTVDSSLATINVTQNGAGAQSIYSTDAAGVTVNATSNSTGATAQAQKIVTGTGADTINLLGTYLSATVSVTGGGGADTINLLASHTGVDTIIYSGANQGGNVTQAQSGTGMTVGETINNFSVAAPVDLINVHSAGNNGTAAAATGVQGGWNMASDTVYVETGTSLVFTAGTTTAANVATAIGAINSSIGNIGEVAIQGGSNLWNVFQVTSVAAHSSSVLSLTDTITLIGTFHTSGALVTGNFTV